MLKLQKNYPVVFAHTRKRDAGRKTKIPLHLQAGDKKRLEQTISCFYPVRAGFFKQSRCSNTISQSYIGRVAKRAAAQT